ncbi:MAG: hypothetical protein NVSMB4_00720 [Acidimicrobiales bacterium]
MPSPTPSTRQIDLMDATLSAAVIDAARRTEGTAGPSGPRLASAATTLGRTEPLHPPHPAMPEPGTSISRELTVGVDDTAAAMGHPDATVNVLGTPRIALWFELVASELLIDRPQDMHVGVGILVHHLEGAYIGEVVSVTARVVEVDGRRITIDCDAVAGQRLVATGTHSRLVLQRRLE